MTDAPVIFADSVTSLPANITGAVVVGGSHGGRYVASLVVAAGACSTILNDAAVGRDGAGVAGVIALDRLGIAAAAVSSRSAGIGDAHETLAGRISVVNLAAAALGCRPGQSAEECVARIQSAPQRAAVPLAARESRRLLRIGGNRVEVWAIDSAALARDADRGSILLTGSHGALIGNRPEKALAARPLAAAFNDAGGGEAGRGTSRLPVLDDLGVAAVTVYAASARIGDGDSTFYNGRVSGLNRRAELQGAREGMRVRDYVELLLARTREEDDDGRT